jgi:ABC-2 type transport system permease protein
LAAFTNIVIFNLVTFISSIVIVGMYSDGEAVNSDITITMVGMFILQLVFMVIGSAIAAIKKRSKTAASLATGILLLTFVISIAIDLNEGMESLKYFSPFKYYEAKNMMFGGGLDALNVVLSLVVIAALSYITNLFYKKRDLHV